MAGNQADMANFKPFAYTAFNLEIRQKVELFNEATRGCIVLTTDPKGGDFFDRAIYDRIPNLVERRDAYGGVTAINDEEIKHIIERQVKVDARTRTINMNPSQWLRLQLDPAEAGAQFGKQLARAAMQDKINTAITGLVAAMSNVATIETDVTVGGKFTPLNQNAAIRKFGDRGMDIVCWVCHSSQAFDFFESNLTNTQRLFVIGNVKVLEDPFGNRIVMTDSPSLVSATPGHFALGLVPGACVVSDNDDFFANAELSNGGENIGKTMQAEWSFNLGIKTFAWDETNGGASPDNTALALNTNWDRIGGAPDDKDMPGVKLETD